MTPRVMIAAAMVALYGAYSLWNGIDGRNWIGATIGAAALLSSVGVLMHWHWARWIVVLVSIGISGTWLYALVSTIQSGHLPFTRPLESTISLLPGLTILAVAAWCAIVISKHFSVRREQT